MDSRSEQAEEEHQPPPKKKRAAPEQREWTEVNAGTTATVRRKKFWDTYRNAGIQDLPGSHKDRKDVYGNFHPANVAHQQ